MPARDASATAMQTNASLIPRWKPIEGASTRRAQTEVGVYALAVAITRTVLTASTAKRVTTVQPTSASLIPDLATVVDALASSAQSLDYATTTLTLRSSFVRVLSPATAYANRALLVLNVSNATGDFIIIQIANPAPVVWRAP
jgi:hypothetical protein